MNITNPSTWSKTMIKMKQKTLKKKKETERGERASKLFL